MDKNEDIVSLMNSLHSKIEDLETRIEKMLMKQLQTKKELDLIQDRSSTVDDVFREERPDLEFPEDYHFTENIQQVLERMTDDQKTLIESVENSKKQRTCLKGLKIFDEMNTHLHERLEYLEKAKALIEGPLLKPLPPPETPPVEEEIKEEKGKGKKAKKETRKKSKK